MAKRGRSKTTGRFKTREELERRVAFFFVHTTCSFVQVAHNCKISEATVRNIIHGLSAQQLMEAKHGSSDANDERDP